MKALNLMQFIKLNYIQQHEYLTYLGLYNTKIRPDIALLQWMDMVNIYINFLDKFKPEMITKLFEGWEIHGVIWGKVVCNTNNEQIQFQFDDSSGTYMIFVYGGNCAWDTLTPHTLNEFISDCQRAEIELKFKQGAGK